MKSGYLAALSSFISTSDTSAYAGADLGFIRGSSY